MKRIAVFGSGSGSNAESIYLYFKNHKEIEVALFLSNRSDAGMVERGKKLGVKTHVFGKKDFYESDVVLNILAEAKIDLIVLAGFLWLIPANMISRYPDKIINIHPALLPRYGGPGMYGQRVHEAVLSNKEKESGITIHLVNEKFDEGEIISQVTCELAENETAESLAKKVQQLEHEYYPKVIEKLLLG